MSGTRSPTSARRAGRLLRLGRLGFLRAQASGSLPCAQTMRRIDEREMRESLRKVAEVATVVRIVFLRQKPHVIAQSQQPLEQSASLVVTTQQHIIVDQPEAAGEKGALARGQAVDCGPGVIAQDKSVAQQLALDGGDCALDARI